MPDVSDRIIALLHGPDQPGLVARVSGWIYERGGNIIHADQHRDNEEGIFFQRIEWAHSTDDLASEAEAFRNFGAGLGMNVNTALKTHRPRIAIFASKVEHCFHDILLRCKTGEYQCDVAAVISNHRTLEEDTTKYGVPFHYIPVEKVNKPEAERAQIELVKAEKVELVILARYMQVLSADMLSKLGCPAINIHHSFLPAFAGARPYHQAFARGVKLIGATAHYVTPVLDDGPIIQQAVDSVSHRHNVSDLVRKGKDLEKIVLAQAVRWHLEHRILVYNNKTVVFD